MTQTNNQLNETYCKEKLTEVFGDGAWEQNRFVWKEEGYKIEICSGCGFVSATVNDEHYLVRFWSTNFETELTSLINKIK